MFCTWFVNGWIIAIDQWKPHPGPEFLNRILFWVRIRGIPIHLVKKQTVESIMEPHGKVEAVELHAKNSSSLEYVRARIWIRADDPLCFSKMARFSTGEQARVEIEYEKLRKVCFLCKRLTHDKLICPFQLPQANSIKKNVKPKTGKKAGITNSKDNKINAQVTTNHALDDHGGMSAPTLETGFRQQRAKDRLQWPDRGNKKMGSHNVQEWRPKSRTRTETAKEGDPKSSGESISSPSKKRKLINSGDRQKKKAKMNDSEEVHQSPSVFERLESSEDTTMCKKKQGSSGEKKQSPSVFERLGSQASCSTPKSISQSDNSIHSAHVAAPFLDFSVPVTAQNRVHSGQKAGSDKGKNLKEGLMLNSNPSKTI